MPVKPKRWLARIMTVALVGAATSIPAAGNLDPGLQCRLGAYRLSDGRSLAVTGFDGSPHDLRYLLSSGEYGQLSATPGGDYNLRAPKGETYGSVSFAPCAKGEAEIREEGRHALSGRKLPLQISRVFFESAGAHLFGTLVMPTDGSASAVVVWVEGSNDDPSTDDLDWQFVLPLNGIGVFVYDKRGTGQSGGQVSADFYVRAADTAAAAKEARQLAPEAQRFGVFGGSQGGWVAPLAATLTPLDFVIVGYGLAEGVTAQDRDEVEEEVRAAGFGDNVIPKVREITDATTRIVKSGWTSGYDELTAVEKKYSGEPWFKAITTENGYTGMMLKAPVDQIRTMGPKLDKHVSFNYDPRPVIESIRPRQLWILGGADHTAPNARTIEILKQIQTSRSDLDLVVYEDADHGLTETFESNGITRHRYPAGLSDLITNWITQGKLPRSRNGLAVMHPTIRTGL